MFTLKDINHILECGILNAKVTACINHCFACTGVLKNTFSCKKHLLSEKRRISDSEMLHFIIILALVR